MASSVRLEARATDDGAPSPYEVDPRGRRVALRARSHAGRGLVVAAVLADVVFAASTALDRGADLVETRPLPYVAVLACAWLLLDLGALSMRPFALRWRLAWGLAAAAAAATWIVVLAVRGDGGGLVLPVALLGVGAFGAVACGRALRLGARAPRAPATPPSSAVRRRSVVLAGSGVVWMACGVVEAWRSNWWFGMVLAAGGVLALALAPELARPRGDRLLPRADRRRPQGWIVWPLAVPLLLARVVWVLTTTPIP